MKFATKSIQHYPPHLRHVATLPSKIEIQIFCKYSADMEENANKLHFVASGHVVDLQISIFLVFLIASFRRTDCQ